jgi:hypothetical protein
MDLAGQAKVNWVIAFGRHAPFGARARADMGTTVNNSDQTRPTLAAPATMCGMGHTIFEGYLQQTG